MTNFRFCTNVLESILWTLRYCCYDYYRFCFWIVCNASPLKLIAPKMECILWHKPGWAFLSCAVPFRTATSFSIVVMLRFVKTIHLRNAHRKRFETFGEKVKRRAEPRRRKNGNMKRLSASMYKMSGNKTSKNEIGSTQNAKQNKKQKEKENVQICKLSSRSNGSGNSKSLGFNSYLQFMNKVCLLQHICWTFLVVNVLKMAKNASLRAVCARVRVRASFAAEKLFIIHTHTPVA